MYRPDPAITVDNAAIALEAGVRAIEAGQGEIDLGGVATADSSAVATMLAWQRAAQRRKQALVFCNIPPNLQSLIALYGVGELLPQRF